MDALLKECWNLLGVIGAANLVLVDGAVSDFELAAIRNARIT